MIRSLAVRAGALAAFGILAITATASAQQVTSRSALQTLLGSSTTETFEGLAGAPGNAYGIGGATLDALTHPGQVGPGLQFASSGNGFQVNSVGYFGMPSTTFEAEGSPLTIFFLSFTQAFGLDARNFNGYASSGTANVYDGANNLLGTFGFLTPNAPASDFVGWQSAGGIGRVELSGSQYWSPIVDDVEFGTTAIATPEPASLILLGTGLIGVVGVAHRRRKHTA